MFSVDFGRRGLSQAAVSPFICCNSGAAPQAGCASGEESPAKNSFRLGCNEYSPNSCPVVGSALSMTVNMKVLVTQSCPTLCDPVDCSQPGSSVHGILQASILEWVAISFSRRSSRLRDWSQVSCTGRRILYHLRHQGSPSIFISVTNLPQSPESRSLPHGWPE